MSKDYFVRVLVIIVLALLVYIALKPDGDSATIEIIKQQNEQIIKERQANLDSIRTWFNNIKLIEKKETIIRNFYNEYIKATDTITTDAAAIANIRKWLNSLGAARYD